jgi:uncharacterized membrane protein
MKSTARIGEHPLHPMLIPYPFALLSSACAFDAAARGMRRREWAQTADHLVSAGLISALVAATPGIVDYFGTVPPRSRTRATATRHALFNLSALACFALARTRRRPTGGMPRAGLSLELLGTGLLAAGGWLGGNLVYRHRVGVSDRARPPVLESGEGAALPPSAAL